MLVAF